MAQTSNRVLFDHDAYIDNRNRWTYEQFEPYLGHWVAWNLDGKSIVAHARDLGELLRLLEQAGVGGEEALLDYLPGGNEPGVIL